MDLRCASVILVTALAGATSAQAGNLSVDLGTNLKNHDAVSQFVGFMVNDSSVAINVTDSGSINSESGSQNGTNFAISNFGFDGSAISNQLNAANDVKISLNAFGNTNSGSAPSFSLVINDGGQGTIESVPLPAPLAMGGIGLLSLGGFASLKRRNRA